VGHHRSHDGSDDRLGHQGLGPTFGHYSHRDYRSLHLELDSLRRVLLGIGLQSTFLWKVVCPRGIAPLEDSGTWTSERLRCHGLSDIDVCALCAQEVQTLDYLLLGCVHNRETWFHVLRFFGTADLPPSREESVGVWWLHTRKVVAKPSRKGLILWYCWSPGHFGRRGTDASTSGWPCNR
jgi:hypothetical protein